MAGMYPEGHVSHLLFPVELQAEQFESIEEQVTHRLDEFLIYPELHTVQLYPLLVKQFGKAKELDIHYPFDTEKPLWQLLQDVGAD